MLNFYFSWIQNITERCSVSVFSVHFLLFFIKYNVNSLDCSSCVYIDWTIWNGNIDVQIYNVAYLVQHYLHFFTNSKTKIVKHSSYFNLTLLWETSRSGDDGNLDENKRSLSRQTSELSFATPSQELPPFCDSCTRRHSPSEPHF